MNSNNEQDNHANQMNPNNDAYWQSRGYDERPDGWEDELVDGEGHQVQKSPRGASKLG